MYKKTHWTQQEISFLKRNAPHLTLYELSIGLNRSIGAIKARIFKIKISNRCVWTPLWGPDEDDFLRKNSNKPYDWLALNLKKTIPAIKMRLFKLKIRRKNPNDVLSKKDQLFIINNKQMSHAELSRILDKNYFTITSYRYRVLNLRGKKIAKRHNLFGKTFKNLLCIKEYGKNKRGSITWLCACVCGKQKVYSSEDLVSGNATSCGCKGDKYYKKVQRRFIHNKLPSIRHRNINYNLTLRQLGDLFELQQGKCFYTDLQIYPNIKQNTASIDRIDSYGAYTYNNIKWVHKDINYMKQKYSHSRFVLYCSLISTHHSAKSWCQPYNKYENVLNIFPPLTWFEISKTNYPFLIDKQFCSELIRSQNFCCALTGMPLYIPKNNKEARLRTASLDRIDSNLPYTEKNVWFVYQDINFMKGDLSLNQFKYYCELIWKKHGKQLYNFN